MEQPQLAPGLERRPSRSAPPAMVRRIVALSDASDTQSRLTSLIQLIRWIQRTDRGSANHAGLMSLVEHLETAERARNQPLGPRLDGYLEPLITTIMDYYAAGHLIPQAEQFFTTLLTLTCANMLNHDFGVVRGYSFCGNRMTTLARGSFVLPTG